ncbi:hypothetical protein [Actinomadura nitritigenes]|uniref:hypothetical protein n=1 Tax=Actinomadura nitritigenes TaxID=134602 RepID=UPI003D93E852
MRIRCRPAPSTRPFVVVGLAALPLDAMESVAYGPEPIVLVLTLAGGADTGLMLPVTLTIAGPLTILAAITLITTGASPAASGCIPALPSNAVSSCLNVLELIVYF